MTMSARAGTPRRRREQEACWEGEVPGTVYGTWGEMAWRVELVVAGRTFEVETRDTRGQTSGAPLVARRGQKLWVIST